MDKALVQELMDIERNFFPNLNSKTPHYWGVADGLTPHPSSSRTKLLYHFCNKNQIFFYIQLLSFMPNTKKTHTPIAKIASKGLKSSKKDKPVDASALV